MLYRNLDLISRLLICAAVLFSFISGLMFWNRVVLQQNKTNYRPASFVVTGAYFDRYEDGTVEYWLDGAIAGREERFIPHFSNRSRPQSAGDLLRVYPKGTEIEVIFNPDVSDLTQNDGELLRMIQASSTFWAEESRKWSSAALQTFAPVPLAVIFFFAVRGWSRRSKRAEAVSVFS